MNQKPEPIAIIGSSCRFPGGATSPSKLWDLLQSPEDLLVKIPYDRFNTTGFYHPDGGYHGRTNVTHSYLCNEDYRLFDHAFFSIHPREAESMDPQQRILMEVVYEGIEAAGYTIDGLRGSQTGVFVGQMTDDFNNLLYQDVENIPQYAGTGGSRAIMANRVSYFFDWHGPSMNIDTACSSSLVATHQAVQALRNGESEIAVAAGINLIIGPENYIAESKMHMLSPTGRSRMWDADADGYARGEGFAAVVLKSLSQAIADKDHIECIIRETGVNQDGRTPGLTVPHPASQVALIESTYRKCGLDPRKQEDRCQYFEAHGTGTLVGDPKEAEAIRKVFFLPKGECGRGADSDAQHEVLHVGSVKTVIGHSEGTAGLASLLKASLAVQHAKIPPNMHFNKLNPAVEPFYYPHLRVPTRLFPWPELPRGAPRRASINSFGFGGTNAHAIIESWNPVSNSDGEETTISSGPWGPFVLSASSHTSLASGVISLSETLKHSDKVDLADLASTYQSHRTEFPVKVAFSASTKEVLIKKLEAAVTKQSSKDGLSQFTNNGIKVSDKFPLRVLGVFTGQGSQWPSMGARLFEQCKQFRNSIESLDDSLARLLDPPSWTLAEELMAAGDMSRVHLAEISQPLTTALQIALVDLLRVSGIYLKAVVGHSSGEIAAAYAAGYLNAEDAIRLAYYRGVHSQLARSSSGKLGKMMAVGMSFENAIEFCQRSKFVGRITVAASNAKSSVTLSGDADAIMEAKVMLDSEKTFARILNVEKAYHSHHMHPCAAPYMESLRRCQIEPQRLKVEGQCNWYSSVHGPNGRSIHEPHALRGQYWVDNLVNAVLFSQAVDRAIREDYCFDLALEIGPHPALQSPTTETLKTLTGTDIPYHGVLKRGENDITAFEDMLGFVWKNVLSSGSVIKWDAFRQACSGTACRPPRLLKGLPSYCWDHNEPLFRESRQSKRRRVYDLPAHELLGRATCHGNNSEMRWRNIFKLREMEWLTGHQFQHQILFPAAGYVSMALEAACFIAADEPIRLVELQDLRFLRAITLEDESMDIEVNFVIRVTHRSEQQISAEYTCYSGDADAGRDIEHTNFTGHVTMLLGKPSPDALPPRRTPKLPLTNIDPGQFYDWTETIGLQYSDGFLVDSIQRRLDQATVVVKRPRDCQLRIHPATLDATFHGIFAAYSFPGDGRMWAPYLPSSIARVRVNMASVGFFATCLGCASSLDTKGDMLQADCNIRQESTEHIQADVEVFCATRTCHYPEVQIEGLTCSSFTVPSVKDDRQLFSRMVWKRDITCGLAEEDLPQPLDVHDELYETYERTAYYYLRRLCNQISSSSIPNMEWHFQCLMDWALNHVLPMVEAGQHPRVKPEWANDTHEMLVEWKEIYAKHVEMQILHALGERLPAIVLGHLPTLDILMEEGRLYRLYKEGLGFPQANQALASLTGKLSHQYPRMRILEIGAGTGSSSSAVLASLGGSFESYTYTDVSPSFFEKAQVMFAQYTDKMCYQVLDIERCPLEQGCEEGVFDLVIASNVLHATRSLANTLRNCRKLMRPGGRLILLEFTSDMLYGQFIFAGLPGWWLGRDDGRVYSPTISESQWSALLRENGFSGVDHVTRDHQDSTKFCFSVMVSQAVNAQVDLLRKPLGSHDNAVPLLVDNIAILGGNTLEVSNLALQMRSLLSPFAQQTTLIDNLDTVDNNPDLIKPGSAIVCLGELEDAVLSRPRTGKRLKAIQSIFHHAGYVLWVTRGRLADKPLTNMMVGIGRSVMMEIPHLRMLFVDIESSQHHQPKPTMFSEMLLRMICIDREDYKGILWSAETELVVDKEDNIYIPRVRPDGLANRRLNAERRAIEKTVDVNSTPVAVISTDGLLALEEAIDHTPLSHVSHGEQVQVRVHSSSMFAFSAANGTPVYLCEGSTQEPLPRIVLALSPVNASSLKLPVDQIVVLEIDETQPRQSLQRMLMVLLCKSLLADITGTLWVHDADADLAKIMYKLHKNIGVNVFFSTSNITSAGKETTFIHPQVSRHTLACLVPQNVQRFVYAGMDDSCALEATIRSCWSNMMDVQYLRQKENKGIIIPLGLNISTLHDVLLETAKLKTFVHEVQANIVEINHVSSLSGLQSPVSIIDWTNTETVSIRIRPLSPGKMFSPQKTYFLVGMTGEVGMSLIEWITLHGGRHFAVASRKPRIEPEVMLHLQRKGANIKVYPLDISDKHALLETYRDIVASMPPIGGVANGALVLRDRAFSNMALDDLEIVLQPKVQGTINLDELFYTDDLDFFILFSSLSSIFGNAGQSNYGAANMFMSSLATQRRRRGLASSVIHLAALLGLGYVGRELERSYGTWAKSQLNKFAMLTLSEPDLRVIFAEAIACGRPESELEPDLITGLCDNGVAPWRHLPMFSHNLLDENEKTTTKGHDQAAQVQLHGVRSQLAKAASHQEALDILEMLFCTKLGVVLQTQAEKINKTASLTTLGIDSLIAVEARSWFLKELAVDIPILKMLGGSSLADICRIAVTKISDLSFNNEKANQEGSGMLMVEPVSSGQSLISSSEAVLYDSNLDGGSAAAATSDTMPSDLEAPPASPVNTAYERIGDMSHAQSRLFFLHEYLDDKSTFNVGYVGKFTGVLDLSRLQRALYDVCKQHESLRSSYFVDKYTGRPVQAVNSESFFDFVQRQIGNTSEITKEIDAQKKFTFNIERGHVLRVTVLSLSPSVHHIIFLHHHIALDGMSWLLFVHSLQQTLSGEVFEWPAQQCIDMSSKEHETRSPTDLCDELAYWGELHKDPHEPLPIFPFAKVKNRQILKFYDTETVTMELEPDLAHRVRQRAAALSVTPFHFYLATFAVFLARCLDVRDFSIGIVDANRRDPEDYRTVGCFLNLLPLRFRVGKYTDESFEQMVKQSRDMVLSALANSRAPFDAVLNHLRVSRSGSHHPLFQVMLNYRQGYTAQTPLGDGNIEWDADGISARYPYDLSVDVTQAGARTALYWTTQKYMYDANDSKLMMKWYMRIVESLTRNPAASLSKCLVANDTDLRHVFRLGEAHYMEIGWTPGTIIHRVEKMAVDYPDSTAIICSNGNRLTYDQMLVRSLQISRHLLRIFGSSAPINRRVGMLLDPQADQVCSSLAIMRLGLVCIPLDLRNPDERLAAMVSDCRPQVILCNGATKVRAYWLAAQATAQLLDLDEDLGSNSAEKVANISQLSHPAVILYTSGSTGVPKGVLISHDNILNHIFVNTSLYTIGREVVLQQSSLGFDLSLDQTFHALANGGTLVIVSQEGRGDPAHIAQLMLEERVTYTLFCPSEYLSLLNYGFQILKRCSNWKFAFSLGEKLTLPVRKAFQKLGMEGLMLINAYGPTEATIACARGVVPYRTDQDVVAQSDFLWPMPNHSLLIMDEQLNPQPVGFPGEICIGGMGVTLGYLNRPEESQKRFFEIDTTSLSEGKHATTRLYRTGDQGRLLEDGSLEVLGRLSGDSQVKIRGHRVELDEIANVIVKKANRHCNNAVVSVAVSYRHETDILLAFVVFDSEFTDEKASFADQLKTNLPLPAHMCPTLVVPVERIPMTINGKQDRAAIDNLIIPTETFHKNDKKTDAAVTSNDINTIEQQMKQVWLEVLAHRTGHHPSDITAHSNFFQVGGNSIMAIKLRSVIQTTFGVTVRLPELFRFSTLSDMAACVHTSHTERTGFVVDWSAEIAGLYHGLPQPLSNPVLASRSSSSRSLNIVLTGATGFLGTQILNRLISDPLVAKVYCIAIRPASNGKPRNVSVKSPKIIEHVGDLSDPSLGLSDAQFRTISDMADLIIHNGARISYLQSYSSLRGTNVISTRTLAAMALPRRVPIHFVSSAAVAGVSWQRPFKPLPEVSISDLPPAPDALDGYGVSKWAAESLLERVSSNYGLPVWVHRPATIIGDGTPALDLMTAIIAFSHALGAVPKVEETLEIQGSFDLVPVKEVAKQMVEVALENAKSGQKEGKMRFVHHCNDTKVLPGELRGYMEKAYGRPCGEIPVVEWLNLAQEKGLSEVLYTFLNEAARGEHRLVLPEITK